MRGKMAALTEAVLTDRIYFGDLQDRVRERAWPEGTPAMTHPAPEMSLLWKLVRK
jgi:hypothetical protein